MQLEFCKHCCTSEVGLGCYLFPPGGVNPAAGIKLDHPDQTSNFVALNTQRQASMPGYSQHYQSKPCISRGKCTDGHCIVVDALLFG